MKVTGPNFVQIPNAFLFGQGAKKMDATEMLIYIYIAARCFGDKGSAFPTQETIAEELDLALSTVKENIRSMKIRGVIKVPSTSRGGKGKWNTYKLTHWDKINELPDYYDCRRKRKNSPAKQGLTQQQPPSGLSHIAAKQPLQQPPNSYSNSRQTAINNTKEEYELKNTNSPQEVVSDKLEPEPTEALEQGGEATDTTKALSQKNRRMLEDTIINWFSENYPSQFHVPAAFRAAKFPEETLDSFWRFKDSWRNWRPAEKTDRSLTILKSNMDRFVNEMATEQAKWDAQALQSKMDDEDRKESIRIIDICGVWTNRYLSEDDPEDWNVKKAASRILNATIEVPGWLKAWAKIQGRIEGRKNKIYFEDKPFSLELIQLTTRDNILNTMSELGLWSDDDYVQEV